MPPKGHVAFGSSVPHISTRSVQKRRQDVPEDVPSQDQSTMSEGNGGNVDDHDLEYPEEPVAGPVPRQETPDREQTPETQSLTDVLALLAQVIKDSKSTSSSQLRPRLTRRLPKSRSPIPLTVLTLTSSTPSLSNAASTLLPAKTYTSMMRPTWSHSRCPTSVELPLSGLSRSFSVPARLNLHGSVIGLSLRPSSEITSAPSTPSRTPKPSSTTLSCATTTS